MSALPLTIAPASPFLDWPVATDPARWNCELAVVGIPASEPYPGDPLPNDQSRAPGVIREQSRRFCYSIDHWDFDLGFVPGIALPPRRFDLGDCVRGENEAYAEYSARLSDALRGLFRRGTQVVVLGGDHGVTIPVLDALDGVGLPVHVLQIDAHIDWREEVRGVTRGYSSPMHWASRTAAVSGITQVGMRGIGSARCEEVEAARRYGANLFPAETIHEQGIGAVLASIPPGSSVYLTVDADGLDPSEMPGVIAPTAGGLRFEQVARLVRAVARRHRLVGMDIVEIAPGFDLANGMTCVAAGRLVLNAIGASWGPGGAFRAEAAAP